jgi:hypothetical protein
MKIFPPKRKATLPPWNLSRKASVILGVYILTGTVFALYLFTIIARLALFEIAPNYPSVLLTFWNAILKRPFELMPVAVASLDVQWRGLVLLGLALFVLRTLKAIWGGVKGLANYLMENGK